MVVKEKISKAGRILRAAFFAGIVLAVGFWLEPRAFTGTSAAEYRSAEADARRQNLNDAALSSRISRIENGLIPQPGVVIKGTTPLTARLADRMSGFRVPGISVAVINDFKIEWAKGYGIKESGTAVAEPGLGAERPPRTA